MGRFISLSNENQSFDEILNFHDISSNSFREYYDGTPRNDFVGYTRKELEDELTEKLLENDKRSCLSLLSALEALLRINYQQCAQDKKKDPISRKMRELYKEKGKRASLEDDILKVWKEKEEIKNVISSVISAFKYRHWLAHGRYWKPRLGRDYDFDFLYILAKQLSTDIEL